MRYLTILVLALVAIALVGQGRVSARVIAAKRNTNNGKKAESHDHSGKSSSEEVSSTEIDDSEMSKRRLHKRSGVAAPDPDTIWVAAHWYDYLSHEYRSY